MADDEQNKGPSKGPGVGHLTSTPVNDAGNAASDNPPEYDHIVQGNPVESIPPIPFSSPGLLPHDSAYPNSSTRVETSSADDEFSTYFDDEQILIPESENVR